MSEAQQRELVKRGSRRSLWIESTANQGEKHVVKCFHDTGPFARSIDRRRAQRERRALEELSRMGFRVPAPLGLLERPAAIELSMTFVEHAVTLFDLTRGNTPWPVAQERIARELGRVLALARRHGVSFTDLHSKNVLVDATGDVWLVDCAGTSLRGRSLSEAEHTRNVVMIAAELREHTSRAWRMRVVSACERERGERVTRTRLAEWSERARAHRRVVAARSARRWLRASSVTTGIDPDPRPELDTPSTARAAAERGSGLRSTAVSERTASSALATGRPASLAGSWRIVRGAWLHTALLTEHALPSYAPIAFRREPYSGSRDLARVVFDDHGATRSFADVERDPRARRRAARGLGHLLGLLHDRGLTLASPVAASIVFDAGARARFTHLAIPVEAVEGRDVFTLVPALASGTTPRERGLFLAAFLRAFEASAAEKTLVRERLASSTPSTREPARRRIRARVLDGATFVANIVPHPLVRATLVAASPLASFSRFERTTRSNLALALGAEKSPNELDSIARGVRRHAARQFAEWLRLANTTPERGGWIDDLVEIDASVAILERELSRRPGALVVSAHIGNWELLAARLHRAGHVGAVVGYRRSRDSSALWFERLRERYGVANIDQASHPRAILRALDEGRVVGLLADLEVRRLAGEFVPFLGREALTMSAPAALARAARRPLIPAKCVFEARRGRYVLAFEEPLALNVQFGRRERTVDLCTRLNLVFESWIRAHPEQWAWHQPRWRTREGDLIIRPLHARRGSKTPLGHAPAASSLHGVDPSLSPD